MPLFAKHVSPPTDLTKGQHPEKVKWNEKAETAFTALKEQLSQKPVMCLPNKHLPFVLHTDISHIATGAVLLQGKGPQPIAQDELSK